MKSKSVPETHDPSPHEVLAYENSDAGLGDENEGRVENVGETNHAAEEQFTRTHTQPDLEEIGELPERSVKSNSKASLGRHVTSEEGLVTSERRRKHVAETKRAAEAAHEKGTDRVRGKDWAKTIKSV